MDIQKIQQYKSAFDAITKGIKDDDGNTIEVWYARELQTVLGYTRWEIFVGAVGRAMESCKTLGISIDDHFREVTKMVSLGSGKGRTTDAEGCTETAKGIVCGYCSKGVPPSFVGRSLDRAESKPSLSFEDGVNISNCCDLNEYT